MNCNWEQNQRMSQQTMKWDSPLPTGSAVIETTGQINNQIWCQNCSIDWHNSIIHSGSESEKKCMEYQNLCSRWSLRTQTRSVHKDGSGLLIEMSQRLGYTQNCMETGPLVACGLHRVGWDGIETPTKQAARFSIANSKVNTFFSACSYTDGEALQTGINVMWRLTQRT